MNTEQHQDEIEQIASEFPFVSEVFSLHRGPNTLKVRLKITSECFVQVYQNLRKGIVNYVLVAGSGRVYGKDCDGGRWHRHPANDPDSHDFSREGSKEVDLREFLEEVYDVLKGEGIL